MLVEMRDYTKTLQGVTVLDKVMKYNFNYIKHRI